MTSETPESAAPLDLLEVVDSATQSLLTAVESLRDSDIAEPSLLPGWTRGHVLAHLARNADGLVNLLLWARTGIETPQYASQFLRDADIEAGAPRPLAEQLTDLRAASDRFRGLARAMPAERWAYRVRARTGKELPATVVPWLRLREIEIHRVDLNIGYRPEDWPAPFVARMLPDVSSGFDHAASAHRPADAKPMTTDPDQPPPPSFTLVATDTDFTTTVGPDPSDTISGPAAELLAWLIGRGEGAGLKGFLPNLPAWL
ncbi:maleylpyruvate isomerase family mycothiol-dependent enzyme [Nocardia spumae]|uniref:maleylpyruvate isomerase family mycothiol-dependent enzyme n=1 Tax=Nocardia spumae TaxID=2887190 RepID=UPI001D143DA1|nr:maleylpyruvate isomerase family mycothiol-dependent enzyme [Nocardia spumae]